METFEDTIYQFIAYNRPFIIYQDNRVGKIQLEFFQIFVARPQNFQKVQSPYQLP